MKNKTCGIYCIENKLNFKKYIGSSVDIFGRWALHKHHLEKNKHHNVLLQRAYSKYGIENFKFEILELVEEKLLIEKEQFYINKFNSFNPNVGYNLCPIAGNSLGVIRTEEFKKKCSESKKGILNVRYGIKLSNATLKKCSESKKGNKNPMFGKTHTEVSKQKRTDTILSKYGKFPNKGKTGKNNPLSKKIKQIKNGQVIKIWDSIADIGRELGWNASHISCVAHGKRKSAHGYQWEFI